MPCFESHGFLPNLVYLHVYYIFLSCSLNLHDLVTYTVKTLLVGLVYGSFQFIPQSFVVLPSFIVVDIFPLQSSILLITSCVIHGLCKYLYKIVINTFIVLYELCCRECKQYANRLANKTMTQTIMYMTVAEVHKDQNHSDIKLSPPLPHTRAN